MLTAFYAFALVVMFLKVFETKSANISQNAPNIISTIGKSSYHIYLTQMVYYCYAYVLLHRYLNNILLEILLSIIICCCAGILFYIFEEKYISKISISRNPEVEKCI